MKSVNEILRSCSIIERNGTKAAFLESGIGEYATDK